MKCTKYNNAQIKIHILLRRLIPFYQKSSNCEIWSFHSIAVSLVGRPEDFKPANQRNMSEDQYPESRHSYLQCIVVRVHVLYCDSGTREKFGRH
jgi:hypothetical protein